MEELTYEYFQLQIDSLRTPEAEELRDVLWIDSKGILGISRTLSSEIELFIKYRELVVSDEKLRQNLRFNPLRNSSGEVYECNRLVLPKGDDFDDVAAFISKVLVDNGLFENPQTAFSISERTISLAFEITRESKSVILGILGELTLLHILLSISGVAKSQALSGWFGFDKSTRDFFYSPVGIEVKSTSRISSRHHIQGFHQIEVGHGQNDFPETNLYLLSLGFEAVAAKQKETRSVKELIQLCRIELGTDLALIDDFDTKIKSYLKGFSISNSDLESASESLSDQNWKLSFARLYDMSDNGIKVLKSQDVQPFVHSMADSFTFDISLPTEVSPGANPISGLESIRDFFENLLMDTN